MIALITDPSIRTAVDAQIDAALARIVARASPLGEPAAALADAVARATGGGKRFRPALVVASFAAFGDGQTPTPAVHQTAAVFELLHAAFVVHDDVIDHDTTRRGVPNVSGEFRARALRKGATEEGATVLGDAAGILAGDLLLHEAERILALLDADAQVRATLLDIVDDAIFVSVAGELADVENAVVEEFADADDILHASHNKTAVYSFGAPLRAGAVLAGAHDDVHVALQAFGSRLGLAFQLIDDAIGAFGSRAQAGRDEGSDLREAKRTPLVALARESATWSQVSDALAVAHTGPIAVREAQRMLHESGARSRLIALVDDTLAEARRQAAAPVLPERVRAMLLGLTDAVEERMP